MGLDVVYRTVVRDHNGHIYVNSEPGSTTFAKIDGWVGRDGSSTALSRLSSRCVSG